jgi:hypothetical protein
MNPIVQKMPEPFVFDEGPTEEAITGTKWLTKPGINDRKSCRRKVPQARQSCELKIGANVLSASLVDESNDGFSVLIDRLDGLKVGKKVELHVDAGSFVVRIVYINKVAPPRKAAPECDSWFQLGVKVKQRLQP